MVVTTLPDRTRKRFAVCVKRAGGDSKVAALLGCSRSHVHHIRTGKRSPGRETASDISHLFGIPADGWDEPRPVRSRKTHRPGKRTTSSGTS